MLPADVRDVRDDGLRLAEQGPSTASSIFFLTAASVTTHRLKICLQTDVGFAGAGVPVVVQSGLQGLALSAFAAAKEVGITVDPLIRAPIRPSLCDALTDAVADHNPEWRGAAPYNCPT